jgi:hypothetical protein
MMALSGIQLSQNCSGVYIHQAERRAHDDLQALRLRMALPGWPSAYMLASVEKMLYNSPLLKSSCSSVVSWPARSTQQQQQQQQQGQMGQEQQQCIMSAGLHRQQAHVPIYIRTIWLSCGRHALDVHNSTVGLAARSVPVQIYHIQSVRCLLHYSITEACIQPCQGSLARNRRSCSHRRAWIC